ncbi:hypothetical protein N7466_008590 [Penicillium verhagenii]|uniref:uncharacterized protein n=1 Tax=Penicillium verhagenii TaxID=1562060 RepID=UPI00254542F0|nr:uncharacterized protein N7466_008590 [Penicillium verhagenii]KAJ5924403.1 hypothetical protein N7466_008590 [Penicillium verhagenii]
MNREIPGFYYDPEKKKYFQIQKNHVASGSSGSSYSNDAIKKKEQDEKKKKDRAQLENRIRKERVQKAGFYNHAFNNVALSLGLPAVSTPVRLDQQARTYASQLEKKRLWKISSAIRRSVNPTSIREVVRHPSNGNIFISGQQGSAGIVFINYSRPDSRGSEWSYRESTQEALGNASMVTSMTLSPADYMLFTIDATQDGFPSLYPRKIVEDDLLHFRDMLPFSGQPKIRMNSTVFCSAACPTKDRALFAIGTSGGVATLEGELDRWTVSNKPFPRGGDNDFARRADSSHACVTAVDWLSTNVIAAGMRDSTVILHDLRTFYSATRLQHPETVSKIVRVSEHCLAVAGPSKLQLYDIRFAPNGLQRKPNPMSSSHTATRPYLSMQNYSPNTVPGFDVSPELSLLASASDKKVQLFSLRSGTEVSSPLTEYEYSHQVSCVRFEDSEKVSARGPRAPSLLVCAGTVVDQWAW